MFFGGGTFIFLNLQDIFVVVAGLRGVLDFFFEANGGRREVALTEIDIFLTYKSN